MPTAALTVHCQISGQDIPLDKAVPVDLIRDALLPTLKLSCPNLDPNGYISMEELNKARLLHAEEMSRTEMEDLVALKKEVAKSLLEHQLLTKNIDHEFDLKSTRGEKLADKVAAFGGSWTFIIMFGVILLIWMSVNTAVFLAKPFDPFPYIFLNLVLSCLAAIQAPVIMMSQNRQEAKDRMRGENDYKINLKANWKSSTSTKRSTSS
jgi:uncharacterized membrane protein